jgi:anti-sigma factor RsiW
VVGLTPVPTLVYRYRNHLISVTAVPAASRANSAPALRTVDGYNVLGWTDDGVAYSQKRSPVPDKPKSRSSR